MSPLALVQRPHALPPPLDRGRVTLYTKARNAIWHVLRGLGVRSGHSVLVPSYNCGAELDAVLRTPALARFYRVDRCGHVDVDDLATSIDAGTRAVLVTHYFGFPQPDLEAIAALCRERQVPLLEDCAHALLSTANARPLGTFGAAAIFSLWKSLPLPDGAAVRADGLALEPPRSRPPLLSTLRFVRSSAGARLAARGGRAGRLVNRYALPLAGAIARRTPARDELVALDGDPHVTYDERTADWSISGPALALARRGNYDEIRERRRRNFGLLAAALQPLAGVRLPAPELANGVTPLCLPVVVDDASGLHGALTRAGIGSEVFWSAFHPAFPGDRFPDAAYLKTHTVALPIHQDVRTRDVARIAAAVHDWASAA